MAVLVAACGAPAVTTSTETTSPGPKPTTTTTQQALPVEIADCDSPPVTFSALCQVFELIQAWHIDRPIDPRRLAELATQAVVEFESAENEPRPRALLCAVPHEAFDAFCDALAQRVLEAEVPVAGAVDSAVVAMADLGLDSFSYYVPPGQVDSYRLNGVVGGIGVLLDARDAAGSRCALIAESCPLIIVFVLEGNPAAEAGLAAGDRILAVDGVPVEGRGFTSLATQIAGDSTGRVRLTVDRSGRMIEFDIRRDELIVPTVQMRILQPDIGYLRVPDFEEDIPALVAEGLAIMASSETSTIILDLRDNPGGLLEAAVEVVSEFADGGLVVHTEGPGIDQTYEAEPGGRATSQRLIVVVNKGTASSAEIAASALRGLRGALIVGTATFGKDAVQIPFQLRNGGELYITSARWIGPGGDSIGGVGLQPDRVLELSADLTVEELVSAVLEATS